MSIAVKSSKLLQHSNGSVYFFAEFENMIFPGELVVQNDTQISNFGAFKNLSAIKS